MKGMMYKNIDCKYPIEIERKEIYQSIFEYILPDGYFFECRGTNYGNTIYAREIPDNFYIVRKENKENENNAD